MFKEERGGGKEGISRETKLMLQQNPDSAYRLIRLRKCEARVVTVALPCPALWGLHLDLRGFGIKPSRSEPEEEGWWAKQRGGGRHEKKSLKKIRIFFNMQKKFFAKIFLVFGGSKAWPRLHLGINFGKFPRWNPPEDIEIHFGRMLSVSEIY